MSRRRKRSALGEQFISHRREMRESAAWRALPDNARRVLDRLELEHMRHGGAENGRLGVTFGDFELTGLRRRSIPLAIRQCAFLGFAEVMRKGTKSISGFRSPSLYRLTYVVGCGTSPDPTDEWRRVLDDEHAAARLVAAEPSPDAKGPTASQS